MILEYNVIVIVWVCFYDGRLKKNQTLCRLSIDISILRFKVSLTY